MPATLSRTWKTNSFIYSFSKFLLGTQGDNRSKLLKLHRAFIALHRALILARRENDSFSLEGEYRNIKNTSQ